MKLTLQDASRGINFDLRLAFLLCQKGYPLFSEKRISLRGKIICKDNSSEKWIQFKGFKFETNIKKQKLRQTSSIVFQDAAY